MANSRFDSIYESYKNAARKFSDKVALVYLGKKYTYSMLEETVEHFAKALYEIGIRKSDKAIIYQPHAPQWIVQFLALQRIGAIAVPITHFYGPREIEYIANDSGAESIFCMDTNFGYVSQVFSKTPLKRIIVGSISENLPLWKRIIGKAYNVIPEGKVGTGEHVFTFRALLKSNPQPLPSNLKSEGDELSELMYTGGTTGFPKGVPIKGDLFVRSVDQQRKMSEPIIPKGEDIIIQGAPLFHVLGQMVGIGALLSGDMLIMLPKIPLDAVFEHISRYRVKSFFGTPNMYRMILEHDRVDYYNLSSIKYCFCAGDTLPLEVENKWVKKFGIPITQGYGTTETCGGVTLSLANENLPRGTVGKIVPHWQIKFVNPDTLESVPPCQPGELLASSDNMVTGYWNKKEETERFFIEVDGRLWYRTGDVLRMDENGYLFFLDRSVDLIKHKGYRVAASKVETTLQENPTVVASCVVGVPDQKVGERIKAFVVLKEGVKGVTAHDLIRWCRERLAPYEVPQYIEFRDMLPKSKVGKLLRRDLRTQERRKTGGSNV